MSDSTENKNDSQWTPFWFEANQAWGEINNRTDWERILVVHKECWKKESLLEVEQNLIDHSLEARGTMCDLPNFGLYTYEEHKGPRTLREFFNTNGMTPSYAPAATAVPPPPAL